MHDSKHVKCCERGQALRRQLDVARGKECEATHKDMGHLQSDHEEADKKQEPIKYIKFDGLL